MGNRAQIIVVRDNTAIHLYTHWNGHILPARLTIALRNGKARWSDDAYLTRILFCAMLERDELYDETGFGISTQYQDSSPDRDLIVNMDTGRVEYLDHKWTFAEWVKLAPTSWNDIAV